jgi:hypothetical protein
VIHLEDPVELVRRVVALYQERTGKADPSPKARVVS